MYFKRVEGRKEERRREGEESVPFPRPLEEQTFSVPVAVTINRRLRRGDTENEETEMWGVVS